MYMQPFYDPTKSYQNNFQMGPFGNFINGEEFTDSGNLEFELFENKLFSPFGIPAGPLINGSFVTAALDKGFAIATYKTVRSGRRLCNPYPNVVSLDLSGNLSLKRAGLGVKVKEEYEDPLSITNSFGVPSSDPDFWQSDMKESVEYAKEGQVVVGSFQGTPADSKNVESYIKDFTATAKLVKETGAKILEVNLSCPNEGSSQLLCFDVNKVIKVVEAIKNEIGNTPLIMKLAYFKDQAQLKKLVELTGKIVQGIQAINTIPAIILNEKGEQFFKEKDRLKSGVCGQAIKWAGLDMARRLKSLREELGMSYVIMGVGGVASSQDFGEYLDSGADAVMSATGAMWNPYLAGEIKKTFNSSLKIRGS